MIEAGKDNWIVIASQKSERYLHCAKPVLQGKGNRSISLNSHYLVLFKDPWDKLHSLTVAKQMYPSETAWFIKEYEEAVRDLRPTTPERCRF